MERKPIKNVGLILVNGYSLMSLASVIEPLRAANHLSKESLYQITFIEAESQIARASSGAVFEGSTLESAGFDFDLVLVAAAGNPMVYENPGLMKYLRLAAGKGLAIGGISGGPVILARANIMENRRFTVHWDHFEALREFKPDLLLEKTIYLIDRDRYTCAGGVAPMDMMSAIIAADHGRDLAKSVNDWFIYTSLRNATEPQRIGLVEKYQVHHPALIAAIELMQDHIADPLSSTQIAELSGIGERQMSRLFQKFLGKKPKQFYKDLRLEHAKVLTQQSALPVIEIAIAAGYDSASYFSQQFKSNFGVSPTEMRAQAKREIPTP